MNCNNTLTDDELEDMFPPTDKEMQKIEQQVQEVFQILLQPSCAQAAHCEPAIKKDKCPRCSKVINCAINLKKHLKSCQKALTCPAEAPEIAEFTLKYRALTFRKKFDSNNKRDVLQQLKDVIHTTRPIIKGKAGVNADPVKLYLSLNMNFFNSTSPGAKTDLAVMFH